MNYLKSNANNIFSVLFISAIFLSDFGFVIKGQPVYFFQLLASIYLVWYIIKTLKVEKNWLIFFFLTIISILANSTLFFEAREFAGDKYPFTSIKGFLNIVLFYAVFKTTIFSYQKVSPSFFLYLSVFMILYGFVELISGSNFFIQKILFFFHTNPRAMGTEHLSLLGREHSYGALGYLIAACIVTHFYYKNFYIGYKSFFALLCIIFLVFFAILAKSKSAYLSIIFLSFFLIIFFLKNKINLKNIFVFIFSIIFVILISKNFVNYGWYDEIKNSITGNIGSGSTYTRWVSLVVSYTIFTDNIFWGVGVGNFKLFYVEYVNLLNFPIIHDLVYWTDPNIKSGSIDSLNFFAGILCEFGIIIFILIFFIILKKIYFLFLFSKFQFHYIPASLLMTPIVFGASLGFYYWAVPFFPFFLAILSMDYKKYEYNFKKI